MVDQTPSRRKASEDLPGDAVELGMRHLTSADFAELRRMAQAYCRAIDSRRSRRRADGSATITRAGRALYGTDDVSDDVTQDAALMFAKRLHEVSTTCQVAALWVETREPCAWQYVRRDGEMIVVTRETLRYWAVRDAAARNGYRQGSKPQLNSATGQGIPAQAGTVSSLAVTPQLAGNSDAIFRMAWGDGSQYPTLRVALPIASQADDLGRAGVIGKTAQEIHGGPRNSSSKVQRTRDAARRELRDLMARLDEVRDEMIYRDIE